MHSASFLLSNAIFIKLLPRHFTKVFGEEREEDILQKVLLTYYSPDPAKTSNLHLYNFTFLCYNKL